MGKPGLGINVVELGAGNKGIDRSRMPAALIETCEGPISTNSRSLVSSMRGSDQQARIPAPILAPGDILKWLSSLISTRRRAGTSAADSQSIRCMTYSLVLAERFWVTKRYSRTACGSARNFDYRNLILDHESCSSATVSRGWSLLSLSCNPFLLVVADRRCRWSFALWLIHARRVICAFEA